MLKCNDFKISAQPSPFQETKQTKSWNKITNINRNKTKQNKSTNQTKQTNTRQKHLSIYIEK